MDTNSRVARLDKNKGRKSYFVEFRHPTRLGNDGKLGKKIRRGLGPDQSAAEAIVVELQKILNDEYWWSFEKKTEAESKFDKDAVAIFYGGMEPTFPDYLERRNVIGLPNRSKDKRYAYILPIGPSGGGKSTLGRQLIGTDPDKHRFPATATAKTTTYDTEIIVDDGEYEAVVTFLPRDQIRDLIEDCVFAAARAHVESGKINEVARKLLEHTEQRFRLNYIVGDRMNEDNAPEQEEFDDPVTDPEDDGSIDDEVRRGWDLQLKAHLASITKLAAEVWGADPREIESLGTEASREKWEEVMEAFEQQLREDAQFFDIVDEIEADIEERIEAYKPEMTFTRDGWPILWYYKCREKDIFINKLKVFTSVSSARWGTLLTPLVSGLRVKGPFRPDWYKNDDLPRWVILDTEGLGHDPSTATAVPTSLTSKYEIADAILLVDSAKQAMTHAATVAALRSLASSGHAGKLMICFTHFDLMDATNLRTVESRQDRLLTSVDNVIASIGKTPAGRPAEMALRRLLPGRAFFLGHLDKKLDGKSDVSKSGVARLTVKEFKRLTSEIAKRIEPMPKPHVHPVYHSKHLGFVVQGAAQEFHQRWLAILGYDNHPRYYKAPWQTIKALTRRLANRWQDHFGPLMPVADLIECFQERLLAFLSHPIGWIDDDGNEVPLEETTEKIRDEAVDKVVAGVFKELHVTAPQQLWVSHLSDWAVAYGRGGPGSTSIRARDMRNIYDAAAPIPSDVPSKESVEFLDRIGNLVGEAVHTMKGRMI